MELLIEILDRAGLMCRDAGGMRSDLSGPDGRERFVRAGQEVADRITEMLSGLGIQGKAQCEFTNFMRLCEICVWRDIGTKAERGMGFHIWRYGWDGDPDSLDWGVVRKRLAEPFLWPLPEGSRYEFVVLTAEEWNPR